MNDSPRPQQAAGQPRERLRDREHHRRVQPRHAPVAVPLAGEEDVQFHPVASAAEVLREVPDRVDPQMRPADEERQQPGRCHRRQRHDRSAAEVPQRPQPDRHRQQHRLNLRQQAQPPQHAADETRLPARPLRPQRGDAEDAGRVGQVHRRLQRRDVGVPEDAGRRRQHEGREEPGRVARPPPRRPADQQHRQREADGRRRPRGGGRHERPRRLVDRQHRGDDRLRDAQQHAAQRRVVVQRGREDLFLRGRREGGEAVLPLRADEERPRLDVERLVDREARTLGQRQVAGRVDRQQAQQQRGRGDGGDRLHRCGPAGCAGLYRAAAGRFLPRGPTRTDNPPPAR